MALVASSAGIVRKKTRGERLTALDAADVIASAVSLALSVWRRQGAKRRRIAYSRGSKAR